MTGTSQAPRRARRPCTSRPPIRRRSATQRAPATEKGTPVDPARRRRPGLPQRTATAVAPPTESAPTTWDRPATTWSHTTTADRARRASCWSAWACSLLAANAGLFSMIEWQYTWPLVFIGLGVVLLARQTDWFGRSELATPYAPPPPRARRRHGGSVIGPLLLIFVGGVFLLQNAGILPASVWGDLWRLWPLVLVLAGLELLIGRRLPWLFAIGGLVIVVAALRRGRERIRCARHGPRQRRHRDRPDGACSRPNRPRSRCTSAPACSISVPRSRPCPASWRRWPSPARPTSCRVPDYKVTGRHRSPDLRDQSPAATCWHCSPVPATRCSSRSTWRRHVPISSLDVQAGATDAHLDLSSLRVSNLDISSARLDVDAACPNRASPPRTSAAARPDHDRRSARGGCAHSPHAAA